MQGIFCAPAPAPRGARTVTLHTGRQQPPERPVRLRRNTPLTNLSSIGSRRVQDGIRCRSLHSSRMSCQRVQQPPKSLRHIGRGPREMCTARLRVTTAAKEPAATTLLRLGHAQSSERSVGARAVRKPLVRPLEERTALGAATVEEAAFVGPRLAHATENDLPRTVLHAPWLTRSRSGCHSVDRRRCRYQGCLGCCRWRWV